ncbi:AAA family ATPase [Vibrio celticus]|uniref:ATP-dependent RecD-like DNA helicase n=1 Tax=Vibrio celticus TaxID=446372 RepID=A0A1C3JCX2_9VIBR|nr:AAA family ATPase [Vibrio celticus]SBT12971.1 ATP-dependent RecD-like DNA helicase [Vibrio celticus]
MGLMTVQVTNIRQFHQATAIAVSPDGSQVPRTRTLAISFPKNVFSEVKVGTLWEVQGELTSQTYEIEGWRNTEDLLVAKSALFKRLSGEVLAFYLAKNVEGVGSVIASRVARTENIEQIILDKDIERLCLIKGVDKQRAYSLVHYWPDGQMMEAIEWVQKSNMNPHLGRRMIEVFGPKAIQTVKQNPFLLLALGATWKEALALAESLNMSLDSPQVLCAVAEQAAANLTFKMGDIVVHEEALCAAAFKLIRRKKALKSMVDVAIAHNILVRVGDKGLVPIGSALIEDKVARTITDKINRKRGEGSLLAIWERSVTEIDVREALSQFESTLLFELTEEQREAVIGAVLAPVTCISGGAGTGKTTILLAVLAVYRAVANGITIKQVALSGRASQRMSESTGYEACTIAKLISDHLGEGKKRLPEHILLIIDEASMIDIFSMYRLCGILPEATRILFVGDVAQLPPIGAGLVFHSLTKPNMPLPTFNLSQVKRQASESGIYRFATAIRNSETYQLPLTNRLLSESEDASLETEMTLDRAYHLWCQAGGRDNTVLLSPVRKGILGVDSINSDFQKRVGGNRKLVKNPLIPHFEWRNTKGQWLLEGDPVMVNQNDYTLDVRNGDLGYISEVFDSVFEDGSVGTLMLDRGSIPLTIELLEKLELAYAITVHKSQGSQWTTTIMTLPEEASHMIDQTLLYTGATRPKQQLVIMGTQSSIDTAIRKGNIAFKRKVCLGGLIALTT